MPRVIKVDSRRESCPPPARPLHLDNLAAEARRTVLLARRQADRVLAEAREQARLARRQGERTGYADGFARGLEEGRRHAAEQLKQRLDREARELIELANAVVAELCGARAQVAEQARGELLRFAIELAEKIVGEVCVRDLAPARANLDKALELAVCGGPLTARVNPSQLAGLREYCAELAGALEAGGRVELVGDERIAPGGVKLAWASGEIDATIQTQLKNIAEALLGPQPGPSRGGRHGPV